MWSEKSVPMQDSIEQARPLFFSQALIEKDDAVSGHISPRPKRRKGDRPRAMRPRFVPQKQSRLLNLPAEIRNSIYELIFKIRPSEDGQWTIDIRPDRRKDPNRQPSLLDLLTTCRQIHYEAETMFYGLNHLRYSTKAPHTCDPFLRTLRPRRQRAITALTIVCPNVEQALDDITYNVTLAANLRTLHIELPVRSWLNDTSATKWANDVRNVLVWSNVRDVRILQPDTRTVKTLGAGGFANNSYVFITERAILERARELGKRVEDSINVGLLH